MNRTSATSGLIVVLLLITGIAGSVQALDLSGRCYSGLKPDESNELQGVPVTLYGAPEEGGARTQLDPDTTGSNGWYGLTVQEGYEHYFIVAGSVSDYSFNGASSVSGTVSGNEIHYSTISAPLSEQTLTGNKFWYTSDTPQNNPPVAIDDSATTSQDVWIDIYVLANDSDSDGDPLHINSATDPPHGTTVNHGSHVTYTPDPGFTGTDTFDYTAGDGKGGTDTATVTIMVEEGQESENNPPIADADGPYTAQVGQPITLDGSGSNDPDPGDSIVSYEWDLDNDGQYDDAAGVNPTWTWSTVGLHTVSLKVTNSYGQIDMDTSTVDAQEQPPGETGQIHGRKWNDQNGDGSPGDEPGLADWTIFAEPVGSANGQWDEGEASTTTDSQGNYSITGLEAGTYQVREVQQDGWRQTAPTSGFYEVTLAEGQSIDAIDFGNVWDEGPGGEYDYGDAPYDGITYFYPTLLDQNGAGHLIDPDVFLGFSIDADPDGQPHSLALGDDSDGNDDEDGVVIKTSLITGSSVNVEVTASTGGYLNAWVDFNQDGNWGQADDHVFIDTQLNTGLNNLTLNVPGDVSPGVTYARFRFSRDQGLSYVGEADDGEVEDYLVEIDEGEQGASIGDFVWNDLNQNGLQDAGETGIAGVNVELFDAASFPTAFSTVTNASGLYAFSNVPPADYSVWFSLPTGYTFSPADQGADDTIDSDVQGSGYTSLFTLNAGDHITYMDAGMQPPPTSTPAPVTFPHGDWPTYAQDEISVHPEPPTAGSLTRLCAEVVNNDPVNAHVVTLEFRVANFGIGLPWNAVGSTSVHVPPGSVGSGCVVWTPPGPGHWCIEVVLHQEGAEPQHSQRNIDADEPLQPGESHSLTFPVGNPLDHPVHITLGLVPHLPNWGLELYPDILLDMAPGEIREVTLTVTPPQDESLPADGTVIVDVEAYAEGELIGGFRKTFRPPVPLHRFPDPPYAEGEITVHPYPVRAGEPIEVCVELRNPTADPLDVMVQFSWANFGIGIPFTPINGLRPVHLPPHSIIKECIHWIPPVSGSVCIQVELHMEGYDPQCSQRNIDADEPLQPGESHSLTFPVGNPLDHPVHITLGLVPHLPNWGLELYPDILLDMAPGEIREVTLTVTPPQDESLPADGTVIVDVEAYAEGELIGGFRKVFSPPVTVHRPKDPVYAETEIGVDPYPIVPGQPVELSVELRNPTDTDQVVQTRFSVAPFGIGLPFSDEHIMPNPIHIFVPAHGAARGHVTWNPPPGVTGKFCVQVTLELEGHEPLWSQRNMDVGEPLRRGEPHSLAFVVGSSPHTEPVTITLGLVKHMVGWDISLSDYVLPDVMPGEPATVTLTVTAPLGAELGTGEPIVDVEAYVDGKLLGGFRKLDVPPVSVHKPHEKSYAETEIIVDPYPPQAGQETRVSAVLHNTGDVPVVVNVEFGWADFGMGIPFSNVGMVPPVQMVTLAPSALTSVDSAWTPTQSGHQCILVRLTDPEGQLDPQESQRNVHVAEPPPCGETKVFTFTIYNDSPSPVTVDLGLITFNVPSDWEVTTNPTGSVLVGPHDEVEIKVIVKIPCPPSLQVADILQRVGGGVPTIDVEGYISGVLKGGIQIQFGEIITEPGSALPAGRIHYSKSSDGRATFEPGATIAEAPDGPAQINPDIAVDDQGIIHVVWEDYATHPSLGNIMYTRSDDGGGSFGESVMVDDAVTVSTHQARPQIALDDDGIIHVVWEDYRRDPRLGDIYYSKSTNGGRTFGDDVLVDDPITVTSGQVNPDMVVDSRGGIHIVWEDYRDDAEMANIYYARSTDGGRTFGVDKKLNEVFDHATHHGRPTIVADSSDTLYAFWEDYGNAPNLGDIYCSLSTNGGETFGSNVMVDDPITVTSRQIRPSAVVDGSGIVYVVWEDYRDDAERGNIYGARSVDSGKTFERDVMVDSPFTTSTHQANPAIAVTGGGLVQVVWEDYRDLSEHANIYYSASLDGGKTFGEDVAAGGPVSAAGPRLNPVIAVDELGFIHLVWQE